MSKLQGVELPLMKNQTTRRNKTPKVAPLVALTLLLLTIIPIYYPLLKYPTKNSSPIQPSLSSSPSRVSSQLSLCRDEDLSPETGHCFHKDVEKIATAGGNQESSVASRHDGNDAEEPPALKSEDVEIEPARSNPDLVETTNSDEDVGETTVTKGVERKSTLSNPDLLGTTQSGDDVTRTVFKNDPDLVGTTNSDDDFSGITFHKKGETKSAANDPDLVGGDDLGSTATLTGETKPVLSNPDSVETTRSGEDAAGTTVPPDRDAKTTRMHRRRDVGKSSPPSPLSNRDVHSLRKAVAERKRCDIFSGEWVRNPEAPYYTNMTCSAIQEHQDCLKFGRPDTQYLKWKWKPEGCELPVFDPFQFLELMRGKSLAFVGDSVARNHMQSLVCLLSRVEEPVDVSEVPYGSQFKRYQYPNHDNFTIEIFWSPYLVRTAQSDPTDTSRPFSLFLDEFDEKWTTKIEDFDYVIISAGHWFFRPTMFYVEGRVVGCLYCPESNITHLTTYFSYRRAFRTAFRGINGLKNYKGITFLRTFAPSHFEGGYWDKGGDCVRKRPFRNAEARLEGYNLELYKIQIEELKIAKRLGRRRGLRFRLFDVTRAMLLRPDGHPSKYGHWPQANVSLANDCVHWCLPGPVDTWNDFLVELLMREEKKLV